MAYTQNGEYFCSGFRCGSVEGFTDVTDYTGTEMPPSTFVLSGDTWELGAAPSSLHPTCVNIRANLQSAPYEIVGSGSYTYDAYDDKGTLRYVLKNGSFAAMCCTGETCDYFPQADKTQTACNSACNSEL